MEIKKLWATVSFNQKWKSWKLCMLVLYATLSFLYSLKGITKPCTHLHSAPSTSTQVISTSTQLHPPPPSSFQSPPISMQHPQQYLNQNIACHWAIFPNLGGQKIKSCPFWLKIGTHGNMVYWRCWLRIQTKIFNIPTPKSIFGQFWAQKFKIVRFVWKLVHMVSQRCWLLFQH